jgi:hypothetical protein
MQPEADGFQCVRAGPSRPEKGLRPKPELQQCHFQVVGEKWPAIWHWPYCGLRGRGKLFLLAGEASRCRRLVGEALQRREDRREPLDQELRDPLRSVNVLQPMLAEIKELYTRGQAILDQIARRARDQDLPTVTRSADPGRTMHGETDELFPHDRRLTGVNTHPNARSRA